MTSKLTAALLVASAATLLPLGAYATEPMPPASSTGDSLRDGNRTNMENTRERAPQPNAQVPSSPAPSQNVGTARPDTTNTAPKHKMNKNAAKVKKTPKPTQTDD
ncbi:hypothetical protein [Hansschlegelia plantiphila]|uniref:Serine/threonine protein kinase n=1 Tax=Hansschlegelia plantiphila TaxID=374655 RepID=A0A9W6J163_9HYPH|nr:hypothetical protein [Hansschlegelia plantiphila]GLK67881.1 hypothetical protein GCM10008179_15190 [Hansschlegelia plantiphila]